MFVGDTLQLQPVSGIPVFEKITKKAILNKLGCVTSVNIWRDSVICDRIWENPPYGTTCAIVLQAFLLPVVIILRKL